MTAAYETLRFGTRDQHAQVDSVYGRFNLRIEGSYRSFLMAHARAVRPIELALADSTSPMRWRSRVSLLEDDLRILSVQLPVAVVLENVGSGEQAGMVYVIEGSRLGGSVLAGRVGEAFPTSYLSAVHKKGEWRALLQAFDDQAAAEPAVWLEEALKGARRAFALFLDAAEAMPTLSSAN